MNKKFTVSLAVGLFPLAAVAAGVQNPMPDTTVPAAAVVSGQVGQDSVMPVKTVKEQKKGSPVVPVDLDQVATRYDLTLPPQPVKVKADSVYYRNSDGVLRSRGNVDLSQGSDEIHADYLEGNTKTQLYHIPGHSVWIRSGTALDSTGMVYNGANKGGTMDTVAGFIDSQVYIRGTDGTVYDGKGYLKHGLITTPHAVAETPDYYLTGDDIHIYPGNKFTSENTALWFKHVRVLTYGHYEGRLDERNKKQSYLFSLLPRPDYSSDDGFGVYGGLLSPLSRDRTLNLRVDYAWYTKSGFRPTVQLEKDAGKYGFFTFGYRNVQSTLNDNKIWARQFPELTYRAPRINFGHSGIYMDNEADWGRWAEDGVETGTHKGFHTEITHTPIPLWKDANVRFFTGYRKDIYSTNDAMRRDPYNGVTLHQQFSDHFWTDLWYVKHNISGSSPYNFDTIDNPRKKGVSFGYVLSPYDTFVFTLAQDLDTSDITDRNLTWIRDLHSFMASITYKQVDKKWEVHVRAKDF